MMFHPLDRDLLAHFALAMVRIEVRFEGTPSHAALAPWDGTSALTACLQTFHLIDSQRVHFRDGVRVHGYVINGGQAVNIIPEARRRRVLGARARPRGARAGAGDRRALRPRSGDGGGREGHAHGGRATGDLVNNMAMARRFGAHMETLGRQPLEDDPWIGSGSTDMGDVSHAVPSIHPWVAICARGETTCHQRSFAACAGSERGAEGMLVAAKAMALTTADLLANAELRAEVRREFEARQRQ